MRNMKKLLSVLWFSLCLVLLFSTAASAYIDPSAMTYIIQIIAGVAIAAGAAFGFYWRRLKRLFTRRGRTRTVYKRPAATRDDDGEGYGDFDLPDDLYGGILKVAAKPEEAEAGDLTKAGLLLSYEAPVLDRYDEGGGSLEMENRLLRQLLAEEREKTAELQKALRRCEQKNQR